MVAVIHTGVSLRRAVNYNEEKVHRGAAELLEAGYYLKQADRLSFHEKLSRLQDLMDLNERVKVNTLHISLNFAQQDSLDKDGLRLITASYLDKIGFAGQPYLLYQHYDAGHCHVHIVTTSIRPDGSSINLHNIGKIRSENARKALEKEFGLTPAESQKKELSTIKPALVSAAEYGRTQTKQAIASVLLRVITEYHFTSLAELNAVLSQYRVRADPGAEGSRIRRHSGLKYHLITEDGKAVGVPIKASSFHFKPTIKGLERHFAAGRSGRLRHMNRLKNTLDSVLTQGVGTLDELADRLKSEGVVLLARSSEKGLVYGLTFVDHRTRSVFNGSDLGKQYSAKAVQQMLLSQSGHTTAQQLQPSPVSRRQWSFDVALPNLLPLGGGADQQPRQELLHMLLQPETPQAAAAWQLRKPRRKRKGKSV